MTTSLAPEPRFRPARAVAAACWVPLAIAAVPAVIIVFGHRWFASSDWAIEVLRIGDVGGRHTPLVGVPSRFGWYHPGPAMFWLLAPFDRMAGPNGILLGTLLANLGSLAGALWIAWRRGGAVLAGLTSLALALVVHSLGVSLLLNPWNPWLAFCPFVLFLFLCWSGSGGRWFQLGWAALLGSLIVQTHVGYVPLVLAGLGTAMALAVVHDVMARRSTRVVDGPASTPARPRGRSVIAAVCMGVALVAVWLPPIVQQIAGRPGNLSELIAYFRNPPDRLAGWTLGLGIMANQLRLGGPWTGGSELNSVGYLLDRSVLPALLPWLVLIGIVVLCARRGLAEQARFGTLMVALAAAGAVAVTRVSGLLGAYLVRWAWAVAALLWVAIGWGMVSLVRHELRRVGARPARVIGHLVPIVAVLVAGLYGYRAARQPVTVPIPEFSSMLSALGGPAHRAVDPRRPVVVYSADAAYLSAGGPGLALALERDGLTVRVPPDGAQAFGPWRVDPHYQKAQVLALVAGSDSVEWRRGNPGYRFVARYDPLTARQRARANRLDLSIRIAMGKDAPAGRLNLGTQFARDLAVTKGASRAQVDELSRLQSVGDTYLLYYQDGKAPAVP